MNTFLQSLCIVLKVAWKMIAPIIARSILNFINDKVNQKAARDAVISAMKDGLKDNEAFDRAADILKKSLLDSGKQVSQVIIDTLIQNAYLAVKCESMTQDQVRDAIKLIK